ncbi:PepSY-like domain-containing protein [Parapedobacter soli]|uniref:PepSY-like domain-containing protein n=1 Tax=Parapedobacter soli TaxID=416955 RepID=UPI0021C6815F|nr:PepSY-like domain-containing protein [Parapedobacter soli]
MKKLLLGLCVLSLAYLPGNAQGVRQRGVPAVVLNAFQQQFPKARQAEWEKNRDGNYEVEFDVGLFSRDHQAIISPEGKILRHEEELSSYSLPDAVKEQIKVEFDGYRVDDVKKVEAGGITTYVVELDSRFGDLKAVFGADGKIIKERMD